MIDEKKYYIIAFKNELDSLLQGWEVVHDYLLGPGNVSLKFYEIHSSFARGHVDIEFAFQTESGKNICLKDCISGHGDSLEEMAKNAAIIWANTSALAMLEFKYSLRGKYADHYFPNDEFGFSGWHCIHGSVMGYGHGSTPSILQNWWLNNKVLPYIAGALKHSINDLGSPPHGMKIFFGGEDIAEVRINGEKSEIATNALLDLSWPRILPAGFVRSYVILLH